MKGLRNPISVDSIVIFRSYQYLLKGTVIKINKKSYKIRYNSREILIPKEKVVSILDICTVVWDSKKDPQGISCYFDYNNYPALNKNIVYFNSPSLYHTI